MRAYLRRHNLEEKLFSTRARAVDALRMALALEPLPVGAVRESASSTAWKRIGEGEYLSRDGHWRMKRSASGGSLTPQSCWAEEGCQQIRELIRGEWLLSWLGRRTLHQCAQRADRLNRIITDLGAPADLGAPVE